MFSILGDRIKVFAGQYIGSPVSVKNNGNLEVGYKNRRSRDRVRRLPHVAERCTDLECQTIKLKRYQMFSRQRAGRAR